MMHAARSRYVKAPAPVQAAQAVGSLLFDGGVSGSSSDGLTISRIATSINVGDGEFTIEMWIRPSATDADNGRTGVTEGANYSGVEGNIILDAHAENVGAFIVGLDDGRLYLSVNFPGVGNEQTEIGTTDLRDGLWHHVAVYRAASNGLMELFVDGNREGTVSGPTGDMSYSGSEGVPASQHVFGKEKYEALGSGFNGSISEIRFSINRRYNGATYTVPTGPFTTDANTVGLYHCDENTGTSVGDSSGDGNNGSLIGSPTWSTSDPF